MANKPLTIAASGYFTLLHAGHIEYFRLSKELGDKKAKEMGNELGSRLIIIVNNDYQLKQKKGYSLVNEEERLKIVKAIRYVDDALISIDKDGSVCKTLEQVHPDIFTNGGDRFKSNIPESEVCKRLGIEMIDGLGGKINSSSNLIKRLNEFIAVDNQAR